RHADVREVRKHNKQYCRQLQTYMSTLATTRPRWKESRAVPESANRPFIGGGVQKRKSCSKYYLPSMYIFLFQGLMRRTACVTIWLHGLHKLLMSGTMGRPQIK